MSVLVKTTHDAEQAVALAKRIDRLERQLRDLLTIGEITDAPIGVSIESRGGFLQSVPLSPENAAVVLGAMENAIRSEMLLLQSKLAAHGFAYSPSLESMAVDNASDRNAEAKTAARGC